jgi:clan AA aspartic protease (TIGR02281 family)
MSDDDDGAPGPSIALKIAVWLAVVCIAVGGFAVVLRKPGSPHPWHLASATTGDVDAGADAGTTDAGATDAAADAANDLAIPADLRALDAEVAREPCDRKRAHELVVGLYKAHALRLAASRADTFFAKCGSSAEIRMVSVVAHYDLSEWNAAIEQVDKLIEERPAAAELRVMRGELYERKGDLEGAVREYDQALGLDPKLDDVPLRMADLHERLGRPCDGIGPLTQLAFQHPEAAAAATQRVSRLSKLPACAAQAGTGEAAIPYKPGSTHVPVRVSINGSAPTAFLLDTGASLVALPTALARRLGLPYESWPTAVVMTAGGVRTAYRGVCDEVSVGPVRARRVGCLVTPDLGAGLLGLSFLSRFDLHFDGARGQVRIAPRGAAGEAHAEAPPPEATPTPATPPTSAAPPADPGAPRIVIKNGRPTLSNVHE